MWRREKPIPFDEASVRLGRQKRAFLCRAPEASPLHVAGPTTNQEAARPPSVYAPRGVKALLVIRQENAVMAPSVSVFGLSANWISRRVKAATKIASLGEEYSGHSRRVGMARDLSATGAELPELMTAGQWDSHTMPARYTEAQAVSRRSVARYHRGGLKAR